MQHYLYNPHMFEANYARAGLEKNPSKLMRIRRLERVLGEFAVHPVMIQLILLRTKYQA